MTGYTVIRYVLAGDVAEITLDRPDTLNSLNAAMRSELKHAVERAQAEKARAILITGEGRAFCSGQDLGESETGIPDVERTLRDEYEPMARAIMECDLPIVVAVNGTAAGAGASLALLGDIVIAGHASQFVIAFARIGLMPDVALTYFLPRQVGLARAMGMAMTTEPVDGQRAAEWGLIWKSVPDDTLMDQARALTGAMAKGPTRSFSLIRKAMRASLDNDFSTQLALEAKGQGEAAATRDFLEGTTAFLEKRMPAFEGR